jgi:hypothetical protein
MLSVPSFDWRISPMTELDASLKRWREAGPISEESTKLLIDLREANLLDQPGNLIWAAFVRSLTEAKQAALVGVLELVDEGDAFRLF